MISKCSASCILIPLFCLAVSVVAQDVNITIPLNNTITYENREIYGGFLLINGSSTVHATFNNINKDLSFIVFQVHSHLLNVTLYTALKPDSQVKGTNVGLVSFMNAIDSFHIYNKNENATVRVYISVHGYLDPDPVPGGCNMEFPVPISPYLLTRTNNDYITVDAALASLEPTCRENQQPNITFYMMYLPEMNFYADAYFDGIRKMMTLKNIVKYGLKIPKSSFPINRRILSAYPGTGVIFTVVATHVTQDLAATETYSVYVPSYSYGCPSVDEDGCDIMDDMFTQFLCAILLFVGLFVCFFGHRFFKTEMFLAGFFSGVIITYILVAIITVVDKPELLAASTLSGVFFGAIWLLFWWLYGIPVIAVLLPSLNLGFLLASIFYYRLPGNITYLEVDFNFWTPFVLVMLLTALAVVSVTYAANILCCAILGAYATVLSVDYYLGSNLKFIIINTIRRAVVPNFNKATLSPPFQLKDFSMTLLWIILATLGFLFQHWHNRGRPPFPPPPRDLRESMPGPMMYGSVIDYRSRQEREFNSSPNPRRYGTERTPLLS
ncbi:transmembrane 7 superfamily member 3-like [Trichoplusia ni]|uniref:Transmembrane 7 superfamily member 3-like n=1 Tax=Trichoplusia ni TaxID=7111 RepID=A0A7E5W757_TRINI|nr:transmembrane 7 superfamily member 3-like [Trichoplusia ni]